MSVFLDILDPSLVLADIVGGETNYFHTTSSKVPGATSNLAKLSGANRGKIVYERASINSSRSTTVTRPTRMGEKDCLKV